MLFCPYCADASSQPHFSCDPLELKEDGWIGLDSRNGHRLSGDLLVGPEQVAMLPGSTWRITARPQVPFRGERLFVEHQHASSFLIRSVTVGAQSAMVSTDPIPAVCFATRMEALAQIDQMFAKDSVIKMKVDKTAAELLGSPWALPLANCGTLILFDVEHIGDKPLRFLGGVLGKVTW